MSAADLPALVVITPLFGGLLAVFVPRALSWLWASFWAGLTMSFALQLFALVDATPGGVVGYEFGGWPAKWGIGYRIDHLNAAILAIVSTIGFLSTVYSKETVKVEVDDDRHHLFYSVWLLAIAGLLGITATGDTFNIYVLLEISSLTVYTLVALGKKKDRRALTASLKYLILGSIGATFILLGIGYLLMLTGTLNMADMHTQLMAMAETGELAENRTVLVGFAFLVVGLSLKMALFPLHMWLPDAYTYAPSAVSALVASTATKVGVYMAFRFIFTIFGGVYDSSAMLQVLMVCAGAGIIFSSIRAITATNVKTVLAYSSVGQLAYIVMGFAIANHTGVSASVIHIMNHALIKGGMFMAIGCVALRIGGTDLRHLRGAGRRMPWTMAAFTLGGFGLVGFPLTAGFVSKWFLLSAAAQDGLWWVVAVVALGGILAVIYVWRLLETAYFKEPDPALAGEIKEAPLTMLVPMWILIGLSLYLGINSVLTAETASSAATILLGGTIG